MGVAFPVVIGVGVAFALSDASATEFGVARGCLIFAGLEVAGFGLYWLRSSEWPIAGKVIVAAFLGAVSLAGTLGAVSWVDYRETQKKPLSTQAETVQQAPDVTLRFIYPKSPALVLVNRSEVIARNIKWMVALWNMDLPDRNDPLPIPVSTFDWIRSRDEGGPQNLFDAANVASLLKPGDRLFGSASVTCPDCARGRTFMVYIVWNKDGWFAEVENEKTGKIIIPSNFLKETRTEYFKALEAAIPAQSRIPIGER